MAKALPSGGNASLAVEKIYQSTPGPFNRT
jgi:hypothetical protein